MNPNLECRSGAQNAFHCALRTPNQQSNKRPISRRPNTQTQRIGADCDLPIKRSAHRPHQPFGGSGGDIAEIDSRIHVVVVIGTLPTACRLRWKGILATAGGIIVRLASGIVCLLSRECHPLIVSFGSLTIG